MAYKGKLTKRELRKWALDRLDLVHPRSDEDKDAFIGRCMGSLTGEFPEEDQRRAVCETYWDEGDMAAKDDELPKKKKKEKPDGYDRTLVGVELLDLGVWNGITFTAGDLASIATAFSTLQEVHHVPLKLGHNDEQPFTDGQPALGWVQNVRVEESKLKADFVNVPDVVAQAIEGGMYRHVSVELDFDVSHQGRQFPMVLSGVALLGADIPAVNTLQDLTAFLSRSDDLIKGSRRAIFTSVPKEDNDVDKDQEIKSLKEKLEETTKDKVTLSARLTELEATNKVREETERRAKFAAKREDFGKRLDALVKEEKITPAKREEIVGGFKETDEDINRIEFAVSTLEDLPGGKKTDVNTDEKGLDKKGQDQTTEDETLRKEDPGALILKRVRRQMAAHPQMEFQRAKELVMREDEELARAYILSNGERR